MTISPAILEHYPDLSEDQRKVVSHLEGPLLVIAGPGSGKTYSIVLRTLNLFLLENVEPAQVVMCTFTEKAAFEMRDRLWAAAQKVGYEGDLSELRATTIHGLCNQLIMQHRHKTPLGNNYETLDELTASLFIFDHFNEIIGPAESDLFLGHWRTKWTAIEGVQKYFSKIAEELIDPQRLLAADAPFLQAIGKAYLAYRDTLFTNNRVDFAHLQSIAHQLLTDPASGPLVSRDIRYVLVDEYQDTNYVQEQLLLEMTKEAGNLCVVGDEDQSLYRFRGATVRNILEFPTRVKNCSIVTLTTNYRSHKLIVDRYDRWMASANWSNPGGVQFRYDKKIIADEASTHPDYPSVISIWGKDARDEAERFAEFVQFLKVAGVIEDYSQVALLLHSVREEHSGHYQAALERQGIPAFCPRARTYFDNEEICLMVACFSLLFGWHTSGRGEVRGSVATLADYVDRGILELGRRFSPPHPLGKALRAWVTEIAGLAEGQSLDSRPADYFYQLLGLEPFVTAVRNENAARNLAIFSQLLNVFQSYYHYTIVTHRNREFLRMHLFNSFLRLLHDGGINDYEDPEQPFPRGYVQIMTIHQAKGLEFPVVAVGSLAKQLSTQKKIDRDLGAFYERSRFEPENRITGLDRMRLHYVAFSRAQKILVLTTHEAPKPHFAPIWQGLPQWPYVQQDLLAAQRFSLRERMTLKRAYSFTGDLKIYETCPRQYQFFREYDFTPSRSAVIFFGLLVHGTIEEIHRVALDGRLDTLTEPRVRELFDQTFRFLCLSDVRPVGDVAREAAFRQVVNYFTQNRDEMNRVIQTEVNVSLEKPDYILTGKVDLLLGGDGKFELLDFKTSPKPKDSPELISAYERQLCTYAHILERRHNRKVDRLLLYWTSEPHKEDALMVLPYESAKVAEAGRYFDQIVGRIHAEDFHVVQPPEKAICKECDIRILCHTEGIISREASE